MICLELASDLEIGDSVKKIIAFGLLLFISLSLISCRSGLTFESGQRMALKIEPDSQPIPSLIILANSEDLAAASANYSESLSEWLKDVDFKTRIVVLFAAGQIRDNGEVKTIVRLYDTVQVQLVSYSVGPGNYEVPGWSEPYKLLLIEKAKPWKRQIRFILIAKDVGVLNTIEHFIP
jgi:hypothetical protein